MSGRHVSPKPTEFQDMTALTLDANLFTAEFRLCDTIAEYLANIVAQSHEDPARYANFSSMLINEIIELAFRAAGPAGKIDFNLLKQDADVRICVSFAHDNDRRATWVKFDRSAASNEKHPAHDLMTLTQAIEVDFSVETSGDNRVTLIADFLPREGVD